MDTMRAQINSKQSAHTNEQCCFQCLKAKRRWMGLSNRLYDWKRRDSFAWAVNRCAGRDVVPNCKHWTDNCQCFCSADHYNNNNSEWQSDGTLKEVHHTVVSPVARKRRHAPGGTDWVENLPIKMDKMSRIAGSGAPNNSDKLCKEAAIFLVGGSESWRQLGTAGSRQTSTIVRGAF